jgi:hypothetical protein
MNKKWFFIGVLLVGGFLFEYLNEQDREDMQVRQDDASWFRLRDLVEDLVLQR